MKIVYSPLCLGYDTPGHPESPDRVQSIYETLKSAGYKFVTPEPATKEDVLLVHSKEHYDLVEKADYAGIETPPIDIKFPLMSAGAAIKASEILGFALTRPPGHHASRDTLEGFCYFNNLAVAVKKLLEHHSKIAIIDFDCHFGNGTSEMFYDTKKVLYFSIHQFPAYPGIGRTAEIGQDEGTGYNINMPMPPGSGDDIYLDALHKILPVISGQFKPEIVAVSAGFDAHKYDPITTMNLSTNVYYEIGKIISSNFKKCFFCLEGGYNLKMLPLCVSSLFDGLSSEKNKKYDEYTQTDDTNREEYQRRLKDLRTSLAGHWEF